jgi:antitoxin component YwqK of YwqJK toxin-antitoxin module
VVYDPSGNKTEEELYNAAGSVDRKTVLIYEAERLIAVNSYTGTNALLSKTVYRYDTEGRLIEEISYGVDGDESRQKSFHYNASGKRIEEYFFAADPGNTYEVAGVLYNASGSSLIESVYDTDDRLIEVLFYDDDRSLIFKTIMHYDLNGNLVDAAQYTGDAFLNKELHGLADTLPAGTALFKRIHSYDDHNKKTEESLYFAGSFSGKKVFFYDAEGNKIEEEEHDANGSIKNRWRFSYEFNSFMDWTKQITLKLCKESGGFEPDLATYRTITYY